MKKFLNYSIICLCLAWCITSISENSNKIWNSEDKVEIESKQLINAGKDLDKNDLLEQKDTETSCENPHAYKDIHEEKFSKEKVNETETSISKSTIEDRNNNTNNNVILLSDEDTIRILDRLSKHDLRYSADWNR